MLGRIDNTPNAAILMNSMRSIGYDFESAVADIIDNSISASAKKINIHFPISDSEIYFEIIDDGQGMTRNELIEAMKFGSFKDEVRSQDDLGRFGLGMKTASLSQCKKFTVVSKSNNKMAGFYWDLDKVIASNRWEMYEISQEDILNIPNINTVIDLPSFTVVLWEKLDSLNKDVTIHRDVHTVLIRKIESMEKHIALIFHRFLEKGLIITNNGNKVIPYDPFLSNHPKTTTSAKQFINTKTSDGKDVKVSIQSFILPYFKDLNAKDKELLGDGSDVRSQGFYIYRNKRLMVYGHWFRIKPREELSKNARIKVDIPNSLDDLWSIDIKKQTAIIPSSLLSQLRAEVSGAVETSKSVYEYKGRQQTKDGAIWKKMINERDGGVYFEINKESNLIANLISNLEESERFQLNRLIELIELSLPSREIYNSISKNVDVNKPSDEQEDMLLEEAYVLCKHLLKTTNLNKQQIYERVSQHALFEPIKDKLKEKLDESR